MDYYERQALNYLTKIVFKLLDHQEISDREIHALELIAENLNEYDIDEEEIIRDLEEG